MNYTLLILILISTMTYAKDACRSFVKINKAKLYHMYDSDSTGDILINLYDVNPVGGVHYKSSKDLSKGDEFIISTKVIIDSDQTNKWVKVNSSSQEFIERDSFIYLASGATDIDATWFSIDDPILFGGDESHHTPYALNSLSWNLKGFDSYRVNNKQISKNKIFKYTTNVLYETSTIDLEIKIDRYCQQRI